MTQYKLTYFPVKGLAEPIRMILSYMGKEFEDNRITHDDWPKMKNNTPFGKLPILEVDGKTICQSAAICKYLSVEAGLVGKNDWENLEIDMIIFTVLDIHMEMVSFYRELDPTKKEELRNKMLKESVPFYFGRFAERVKKQGYIALSNLTYADIYFSAYIESMNGLLGANVLENYPVLQQLQDKVYNIPNIKKWIEKRPDTR